MSNDVNFRASAGGSGGRKTQENIQKRHLTRSLPQSSARPPFFGCTFVAVITKLPTMMANGQQILPTDGMRTESASDSPVKLKMTATESLVHALQCRDVKCTLLSCRRGKMLVLHNKTCKIKASGGCAHCKILIRLCKLHIKKCLEKDDCPRSLYSKIKKILKQKQQVASGVPLQSLHRSDNAGLLPTYVPEAVKSLQHSSQQHCDMSHGLPQNVSTLQQQQMGYGSVLQQQQQQGSTMMNYQPPSWESTIQQLDSQQQYDISHGLQQNVSTPQQQQSVPVQQLQGSMMTENQLPSWENQVQQYQQQHQTLNSWGQQQFASQTNSGTEGSPAPTRPKIDHTDGWEQAIQSGVRVIKHASCCELVEECPEPGCYCFSKLLLHFKYCGRCDDCKYFICVAYRHAEQCHETNCLVPLCSKRKQKIALQQYAQGQGVGKQEEESMGSTPKIENLPTSNEKMMKMRQRLAFIQSINLALEHAPQCKDQECKLIYCSKMKKMMIHYAMKCKSNCGCLICSCFLKLCSVHRIMCQRANKCPMALILSRK
ncbi:Hypothetical predicted protein [Cloeon dipterum]|uniref:histone acetyltransferase n=2 Tax=Cloeon dipterum TaxID=197152 RepID=A0A8S1BYK8_9INSE|nr:Hypothetical predicted protein [Cloeon dipterum]